MDLSIVLVNLNAADYLLPCLRSIRENPPPVTYECIVVDNGSNDDSVSRLKAEAPDAHVILNAQNEGFARATNQGMSKATGRFVLLLNPDTLVHPGALGNLVEYAGAHPKIGVLGPRVLNRDGSLQRQCRRSFPTPWVIFTYYSGLASLFPKSPLFARYLRGYEDASQPQQVDAVSGAAMLIRRDADDQIGKFDETFFAYGEDLDYCFRAKQEGWEVWYYPDAEITHFGGKGGSTHQPWKSVYEYHRAMIVYYRKHLAKRYPFLLNALIYFGIGLKTMTSLIVNAFRRNKVIGSKKP